MRPYILTIKDPILLTIRKVVVFASSESDARRRFKEQYEQYVSHTIVRVEEELNGD